MKSIHQVRYLSMLITAYLYVSTSTSSSMTISLHIWRYGWPGFHHSIALVISVAVLCLSYCIWLFNLALSANMSGLNYSRQIRNRLKTIIYITAGYNYYPIKLHQTTTSKIHREMKILQNIEMYGAVSSNLFNE